MNEHKCPDGGPVDLDAAEAQLREAVELGSNDDAREAMVFCREVAPLLIDELRRQRRPAGGVSAPEAVAQAMRDEAETIATAPGLAVMGHRFERTPGGAMQCVCGARWEAHQLRGQPVCPGVPK